MTEQVASIRVEYKSNVEEAKQDLSDFRNQVSNVFDTFGDFEGEVKNFSDALDLAFTRPRRSWSEMHALFTVGMRQIKEGGEGAAQGVATTSLALRQLAERIPGLQGVASAFGFVHSQSSRLVSVLKNVRNWLQGVDNSFKKVALSTAKVADGVRDQSDAWRLQFAAQRRAMLEQIRSQNQAAIAKAKAEKDTLALAAATAKAREEEIAFKEETHALSMLLQSARRHMMTMATASRHMATNIAGGGKVAKGRLADAKLQAEEASIAFERLAKAGIQVPESMQAAFGEARSLFNVVYSEAKKQGEETTKVVEKTQAAANSYKEKLAETSDVTKKYAGATRIASSTTQILQQSFRGIHPVVSNVINVVNQFGRQFGEQMRAVSSSAASMAERAKGSMLLVKAGLIGLGAAAIATIKKTGMLAAEVKTAGVTMRVIARNLAAEAGADMEKFASYVTQVRDSLAGITTRESTKAVTTFLQARLPIGRLNELAQAAKNYGVTVSDLSSSEVLGRLIDFISTGNTALTKHIGIVRTADQMYHDYAKTLGISKEEMSDNQKQMALLEGVMEAMSLTTGVYSEAMKTAGKQMSSMKRLVEESLLVLGERFEPIIAQIIFNFNKLLKWFVDLPSGIHDFIANIIKFTAVAGTLVGVLSVAGPVIAKLAPLLKIVGMSMKAVAPQAIAIGLAIKGIIFIVKAARKAWEEDFGNIQKVVASFVRIIQTSLGPILQDVKYWVGAISGTLREISENVVTAFAGIISAASPVLSLVANRLSPLFTLLSDVVNGLGQTAFKVFRGISVLLSGDTTRAVRMFESALLDLATVIALTFKNLIAKGANWGWNLIVNVANGIVDAATTVVARAMQFVGRVISGFLAPGSPPKEGPLKYIAEWGKGIMNTFLKSFETADFSILEDASSMVGQALQYAVRIGDITQKEMSDILGNVRESVAELISTFRETGEVNEEVMSEITQSLGEGGKEYEEYIRRLLAHQKAIDDLNKVQSEYAEAQKAGFVSDELKRRLKSAEDEVKNTRDAVDWQKQYLAAIQQSADTQEELAEKMADAMGGVGKGVEKVADALQKLEIPDDIADPLAGLGDRKIDLGGVSDEFLEMRDKVKGVYRDIKDFLELPWEEKKEVILGFFSEAGGEAVEWLEKITGWNVSKWVEDFKTSLETAWLWIEGKAQWLYDRLVGESIIPDLIDEILRQFGRLTIEGVQSVIDFVRRAREEFGKLREKREEKGQIGAFDVAETLGNITGLNIAGFFANVYAVLLRVYDIVVKIGNFFKAIGESVKAAGVLAVFTGILALGLKIVPIFTAIASAIGGLSQTIGILALMFGDVLLKAISVIAAPITAIVAAIAALIYGIVTNREQLLGFWSDFTEEVKYLWNTIKPALQDIWTTIKPVLSWIGRTLGIIAGVALAAVISAIQTLWDTAKVALPYIQKIFHGVFAIIYGFIKSAILPVFNLLAAAILAITGRSEEASEMMMRAWTNVKEGMTLIFGGIVEIITNVLALILATISTFAVQFISHLGNWIIGALVKFGILKDTALSVWKAMFAGIWESVKDFFARISQWATDLYNMLVGSSIFTDLRDEAIRIWQEMWDSIVLGIQGFIGDVKDWIGGLIDWFMVDVVEKFKEIGHSLIESIVSGFKSKIEWAKDQVSGAVEKIKNILPFSEPKDKSSPLYGLSKSGEAIFENIIEGMGNVDISRAFSAQLGNTVGRMAAVGAKTNQQNMSFYEGAFQLSFPSVVREQDAHSVGTILQEQIDRASALGHFGG